MVTFAHLHCIVIKHILYCHGDFGWLVLNYMHILYWNVNILLICAVSETYFVFQQEALIENLKQAEEEKVLEAERKERIKTEQKQLEEEERQRKIKEEEEKKKKEQEELQRK